MRALVVSEDRRTLDDIQRLGAGVERLSELTVHEGSLSRMSSLPMKGDVDVLILDCRHGGVAQLTEFEHMSANYPGLEAILVVDLESPELLLRALRLGVREVVKAPISQEDLQSAFNRIANKVRNEKPGQGKVMSFISCKGGSGASFLATNLGYVLAERSSKRVLLVDLNLPFGDAALYVSDRKPAVTLADLARDLHRMDEALLTSAVVQVLPNFGLLAAPEDPTQAIDIRPAQVESLIRFARAHFDYVLLDVGRSLDSCSVQALDLSDHIFPVLQLTVPFLRDAKRLFDVFRTLDYGQDKVRPILNRIERSGDLTRQDAEKLLAYRIFATVPNHYRSVTASVNQGVPILKLDSGSPVARSLEQLASMIADKPAQREQGLLTRLLRRA